MDCAQYHLSSSTEIEKQHHRYQGMEGVIGLPAGETPQTK